MMVTFSVFDHKYGQIWSKNSKLFAQSKKFDLNTNLIMQNAMVVSVLSVLDWK